MRKTKILLFAGAREAIGRDYLELDVSYPVTARQLRAIISKEFPALGTLAGVGRLAVNNAFVMEDEGLEFEAHEFPVVALIPPVSGG